MKQKRKAYQDGFLYFHPSTNKIELYDDCQKLIGVKIAKEDDVIRSGETLAFNTYLVDIGDLEGDCKPMLNTNRQMQDNKVTGKAVLLHPKKKFSPVFAGGGKSNLENKAPSSSLSPSQKIIKEFKKSEMLKYLGSMNSPGATKHSNTDWQVLYTTQKTQKAKKYHDGFLRITSCGFQGRQATLYDLTRRVLDSKFLKKDEVIESGKSLVFDGHLIDVGEPEGDDNPPSDMKAQGTNSSTGSKTELSQKQLAVHNRCLENENLASSSNTPQLNGTAIAKYTKREWHALYTNQIPQKGKKFQSGFLILASCGSFQLQATLLAEDGTILSCKFLKPSEDVRSGSSFQLPNYLVEVGKPCESPEDEKSTCQPTADSSERGKCDPVDKLHGGEPPMDALSRRELKSTFRSVVDISEPGKSDLETKPLRGAHDILSILRKSITKQNSSPTKSVSLEQHLRPQSSDSVQSPFKNHAERDVGDSIYERHGEENYSLRLLNSKDSEFQEESQCKYSTPSNFSMGEEVYDFSYGEHTSKSILKPFSPVKEPPIKLEQEPPPLDNGSNGSTAAFIESMFPKDGLPEELNASTFAQPDDEYKMDIGKTGLEACNNTSEKNDVPSFDLGF